MNVITVKLLIKNSFWKIYVVEPNVGGFQFLLILDLCGMSFHAVVVFGLGKDLLFKSVLFRTLMILFFRRMNFPLFSDKIWRRLVCFFVVAAAAVIWRIFLLLFAFSDGWIGFFLAEIVHPFGWIWRFGRFSGSFSTHSLWFFHICLKKVGLTLSLRDLCSESLVMHSLFVCQSFTQVGPLKPWNKKTTKLILELRSLK